MEKKTHVTVKVLRHLYILYLFDLFHILLPPLQSYGYMECMCVCM